jgi:hypothetical protein
VTAWRARLLAAAALLFGLAGLAGAAPRVAVVGEDAAVTGAVRDAIARRVELVEVDDAAAAPAALAREHRLHAVVVVEVRGGTKRRRATVSLHQGADGKRLARYQASAATRPALAKAAGRKAWRELGKPIGRARAPVEEAAVVRADEAPAEAAEEAAVVRADEAPAEAAEVAPVVRAAPVARGPAPRLALAVEGRPFLRTLRYRDDLHDRLRAYDRAAPAAGLVATVHPWRRGAGRFFAVRGEAELALGVEGSRTADGMVYPTSSSQWSAGARAELPRGGWRWRLDAGYGEHRFTIDDEAMGVALIPDVTYRWLRGGLGVRVPVGQRLAVDAGAGWRQLLGTGDLGSAAWFPRLRGAGIDGTLGATWQVAGALSLHARGDLRRYFFAMHPEVGDELIVGGAVDQYVALVLGVGLALP